MSRGMNKVTLIGNLGQDPEIRYTQNQKQVANLNIATGEQWTDRQTGQKQSKTEWHKVVFFDRLAEIVGQYLKKGSKIYVEGKLQTRKWQNQQGIDQYSTEVVANEMQMLDSRGDGGGQGYGNAGQQAQGGYQQPQQAPQQQAYAAPIQQQAPEQQGYAAPAPQAQQPYAAPAPAPAPQQQAYAAPAPAPQSAPMPQQTQATPTPALQQPQQAAGQAFNEFDDDIPF